MILPPSDYASILRNDLTSFAIRAFYELNPEARFIFAPYVELIAAKLEACRRGATRRLIINIPPRSLKSHFASIVFPAWVLGHNPEAHIICASYGQDLAEKFARDCRQLMQSPSYRAIFATRLAERRAVHDFMTTRRGTRFATSVGGVVTGRGADFIMLDDPLKPDEALSETRRPAANEWYDNSLLSRLNDKVRGCIIIVMQRLHQDDLVGHVLQQEGWEVLSLPAIAEQDEIHVIDSLFGRRIYRRITGDVLHPEREPLEVFDRLRKIVGEYTFVSQYQQNPMPPGGAIIKTAWLQFYDPKDLPDRFTTIVQSWDTANKATELNDYSVCTTWGVRDNRFYLLDVVRKRLDFPELSREVVALARQHRQVKVLIEDKASGTQLLQSLKGQIVGLEAYTPPPGADKVMRLHMQSATFENGHVLLPRQAPWLDEYVREVTTFPGSKFADQVDSTTQALHYMTGKLYDLSIWERLARK